eukprot:TRINITY_DN58949_c0_g1_i1.p1 TRINITY_DN58949_c0_g1~~TRINITY_DN58949_c0_g1_i1.p1  ORF type:complete len:666 (-),score=167.66 TRINITY_DN58949_c0_g1_i1:65-2062(-)
MTSSTAAAMSKAREAHRAAYLTNPFKFCTTLHAFSPVVHRHYVSPWQKDHYAWHRHKWKTMKKRKRGRFAYSEGPLAGVRLEGWPDPGLVRAGGLAQLAERAQADGLKDHGFWQSLTDRTRTQRDVLSAADLTVILDALVSADFLHKDMMKLLCRELIDDADKLSFVEVAVVANAYAHFTVVSAELLQALADRTRELLRAEASDAFQLDEARSLAVLVRAFAKLKYVNDPALQSIAAATVRHVDLLPFADLSSILVAYTSLDKPFNSTGAFWSAVSAKVPGSRMASLCPLLRVSAPLDFASQETATAPSAAPVASTEGGAKKAEEKSPKRSQTLRSALVEAIVQGLRETPADSAPALLSPSGGRLAGRFPAFSPAPMPAEMLSPGQQPAAPDASLATGVPEAATPLEGEAVPSPRTEVGDWVEEAPPSPAAGSDLLVAPAPMSRFMVEEETPGDEEQAEESATPGKPVHGIDRWYNPIAKKPFWLTAAEFATFDATECFNRNRRGALVAEAVDGLGQLWKKQLEAAQPEAKSSASGGCVDYKAAAAQLKVLPEEKELMRAAAPVLAATASGLSAEQLGACLEAYALLAGTSGGQDEFVASITQRLLLEAVRKLVNFRVDGLRQLYGAASALKLGNDPYLVRTRQRLLRKALQKERAAASQDSLPE